MALALHVLTSLSHAHTHTSTSGETEMAECSGVLVGVTRSETLIGRVEEDKVALGLRLVEREG